MVHFHIYMITMFSTDQVMLCLLFWWVIISVEGGRVLTWNHVWMAEIPSYMQRSGHMNAYWLCQVVCRNDHCLHCTGFDIPTSSSYDFPVGAFENILYGAYGLPPMKANPRKSYGFVNPLNATHLCCYRIPQFSKPQFSIHCPPSPHRTNQPITFSNSIHL